MSTPMPDILDGIKGGLGLNSDPTTEAEISPEEKARQKEHVRILFTRISRGREDKKKWEENYEVQRSHDYVRGFQRPTDDEKDAQSDRRYQINKILAALKSKIPTIFYYHPYIRIRPSRGREDTPGQTVQQRAELLQDTINTIIRQPETRFKPEALIALKEANWAFGIIEAGYTAEWSENPFARKPGPFYESEEVRKQMEKVNKPEGGGQDDELEQIMALLGGQDNQVPNAETFYCKHIPARQFLVASNDRSSTEAQDWVGYWEWMYVEDIKRSPNFQNTKSLKATAKMNNDSDKGYDRELAPMHSDDTPEDIPHDMVRVWKIWDQREKKRIVLAEGHEFILKEEPYEVLPLFPLRLEVMPSEWYPIPPIFSQLTEQDEYNDSREWLRLVRKGTRPRYIYDKKAFKQEELEKLETDEFGTFVGVDNQHMDAIKPIPQPMFGEAAIRTLGYSEAGFAEQAASSPIARLTRAEGGAPTATEVNAMEGSGDVRSSYEQQEVADWLAAISSGLLRIAIESMTLPQWVLLNSDPYSPAIMQDTMQITNTLMQIKKPVPDQVSELVQILNEQFQAQDEASIRKEVGPEELDEAYSGGKWDVTADVESMSPVTESQHAARIMQALNMISAPGPGELLALSPELLKSMLNMMGIRSAQDHQAIMGALQKKQMMQQMMQMMEMMQQSGGGGQGGSKAGKKGVAPMPGGGNPSPQRAPVPPSVAGAVGGG